MGNHLLPWKRKLPIEPNGVCRSCGGDSWTISVVFAESGMDLDTSAVGMVMAATTGVGFVQSSTSVSQSDYPNVCAAIVAKLNEVPRDRMKRVAAFATTMERERLRQRGARECNSCRTLFVPTPGKPWSKKGFCSKMCLVEKEGASAIAASNDAEDTKTSPSSTVSVQCAAGHRFDVPVSFCGLTRPCPQCGCKTVVADANSQM
jgi:hypothetical protein